MSYHCVKRNRLSLSDDNSDFEEDNIRQIAITCFVCGISLHSLSAQTRESHLDVCLKRLEVESSITPEDNGLRSVNYSCVICDLNLSKRGLSSRCQHLKRCAKQYGVGVRDLLQMIAPSKFEEIIASQTQEKNDSSITDLCSETKENSATTKPNFLTVLMANAKSKWGPGVRTGGEKDSSTASGGNVLISSAPSLGSTWGNSKKRRAPSTSSHGVGDVTLTRYTPDYKKVIIPPMTKPVIVDGFNYAASTLSDCYFLTHFHSDHYTGLDKHFDCGTIYCSPTTCGLVKLKLGVKSSRLHALELEKKHTILCAGFPVEVTLTEANHCPGAVCLLFSFADGKRILHTGDFRWCDDLLQSSRTLRALAGNKSNSKDLVVYLDTTYCDPTHTFPPQSDTIAAVKRCVRREMAVAGTLFVFGAYGIGKERVYMGVAEEFNMKVHVDKSRWKSMLCYDWPVEDHARLTTDMAQSWLWVVSMNQLNFSALAALKLKKPGCRRVVAFQPTGWSFGGRGGPRSASGAASTPHEDSLMKARRKDGHVIYSTPYSEHSSFTELVNFLKTFSPQRVVPTVNTSKDKVKQQIDILRQGLADSGSQMLSGPSMRKSFSTAAVTYVSTNSPHFP